ncbi:acetolactate synthase large subunit [Caminibacter pacificus]|uniref:Acetolactate synthase n=1 Tax=Caminibacter pacificus TaxID=1424653 RepID=A0AAJ4UYB2_9BACT|nr:acetolactate synthase large subunit [Caminibacter pacificus]QCI28526.1 acetolactate synthase large subunit [Caminibacter pacificus]ROR40747.1 acetolactate synthase large subunit [Caminibacter pacificus]
MKLTGAQIVIESLIKENVEVVFGYPGGAIMNVYDEIYKQDKFKHILTKHEQGAVHMADGYARATGKVGVAMVTSGPGLTNAVTGIATAYTDSIPMVVISGQVPTFAIGTDAFQEVDAVGVTRPITKHNFLVKNVDDLAYIIKEAFYLAKSGRPGPVHIDIPKDVTVAKTKFEYPEKIELKTYKPTYKGNVRAIKRAAEAIKKAKRPVFYIGGGAVLSGAYQLVRELVKLTKIPAVETLMARGVLRYDCPYLMGMVGMHGSYAANMAMNDADLIISLGARFDDRVTGKIDEFAKNADIVHIDIDPSQIGKVVPTKYPIVGDLKLVLEEMMPFILDGLDTDRYEEWREILNRYQELYPLTYKDDDSVIKPQWVIQKTGEIAPEDAVISTDVGQHQMWTAQFYPFTYPRQLLTSGGLGTMGFGFPAALGAKEGVKDRTVINFTGDGSIMMNIQEVLTGYKYKLPVINIILNNNYLGMVRQWQTMFYDDRLSETDLSDVQPDFVKLAESMGGIGFRVKTKAEFEEALKKALDSKKVAIIDVQVDRREDVLPMVPPNSPLKNMLVFKEDK